MNRLGVHAAVWVAGWSEVEAQRAISRASACGFDVVEVPLLNPAAVDPAMTRRVLAEHDMQATCSMGLPADADVSSDDVAVVRRGEEVLRTAVEVAGEMGATYLGGILYSSLGKYTRPPTDRGRNHAMEALARVAPQAAASGVTLGLEPVNRYESNLINTAAQAMALIDDVGADNIVVHLDSYHMHIEEADAAAAVRRCGDRLGYVHIGENHRGYLGSGRVDFAGLFRALVGADYTGDITFESFSSTVVSDDFVSALAIWRDQWQDSDDLATHARTFIDNQLRAAARAA